MKNLNTKFIKYLSLLYINLRNNKCNRGWTAIRHRSSLAYLKLFVFQARDKEIDITNTIFNFSKYSCYF